MGEKEEKEYKRFTVSLPKDLYDHFEKFRMEVYENISRSDLIRKAMSAFMVQEKKDRNLSGDVVGCIILTMTHEHFDPGHLHVHDHDEHHQHDDHDEHSHAHPHEHGDEELHEHDYSSQPIYASVQQTDLLLINDIQHHFSDIILSTTHYHLEFEKCMEIISISGPYDRFEKLKKSLQKLRSIIFLEDVIID